VDGDGKIVWPNRISDQRTSCIWITYL